jgi:lipoprotein-releasing system permease protein
MLAIEKRKTIKQLYCMGATLPQVRNIFLFNGVLSGLIGSVLGLILGYLLCLAQQKYGFINVGETSTLLSAYPIKIVYTDFVIAWFIVVSVVTLVSLQPAIKAAKSIN